MSVYEKEERLKMSVEDIESKLEEVERKLEQLKKELDDKMKLDETIVLQKGTFKFNCYN
jgi:chaperonin cofactor prefoldin|tara:strand:+ start:514 stop:690 length:177 start_codon:yes stop_codon:yes gene_type:complete